MNWLRNLIYRWRYYRVGLDIALMEDQQRRIAIDLEAARAREARLMARRIARGAA